MHDSHMIIYNENFCHINMHDSYIIIHKENLFHINMHGSHMVNHVICKILKVCFVLFPFG
jgi:hypothetical protein